MRYAEFKLLEATGQPGYYTVGDSHAEGLAAYTGKPWINKAKHSMKSSEPMHMAAIREIPKGSVVVISLGANDAVATNDTPAAIASRVASIVNASVNNGNKTFFVLFPVGISQSTKPQRRAAVRDAIKSAISVPITDIEGQALQSDGVHAQPNVYASIGKQLAKQSKPVATANVSTVDTKPQQATTQSKFVIDVPQTSVGSRGPAVMDVQKALQVLGYDLGPRGTDGIRGKYTIAAIKKYQSDRGLKVDGDAGPETVTALNKDIAANPDKFKSVTNSGSDNVKPSPSSTGSSADGATADMDTLEMIKTFESFTPKAYWDHKQWSIGYGSFAGSNREKADIPGPISKEQAEKMLKAHVQKFANDVERWNRVGKYNWNEGQKGALISFAYNIGSIGQLTDQGTRDNATIARKMLEYITASGKKSDGLLKRRRVEQQKFIMNTPELRQQR